MGNSGIRAINGYRFSGFVAVLNRVALGAVFVYAAVPKLLDWHKFAEAVSRYDMLPGLLVDFTALVMPALELVVGMMLVMGVYKRSTAWLTILMNLVFMVAMSQALIRGLDTSCGCFANGEDLLTWWDVVRDLVLIAMAGFIIRGERHAA